MSMSFNSVTIVGRIGTIDAKENLTRVSVATNRSMKDKKTGEWNSETDWHSVVLFKDLAERAGKSLSKGDLALFNGSLSYYKTEKDGVKLTYTSIVANKFVKLTKSESYNNNATTNNKELNDEIPF